MNKYILFFVFGFLFPLSVFSQGESPSPETPASPIQEIPSSEDTALEKDEELEEAEVRSDFEEEKIIPLINAQESVEIGQEIFFDASGTKKIAPSHGIPNYSWDFGDGSGIKWGETTSHIFESTGVYTVKLKVSQGRKSESVIQDIVVYDRKGVLVVDASISPDPLVQQAGENGIFLQTIVYPTGEGLSGGEELTRRMQERLSAFQEAEVIMFYGFNTNSFQLYGQLWQKLSEENKFNPEEKLWVQVLETGSLESATKLLQPVFITIKSPFILVTRPGALNIIFRNQDLTQIVERISLRKIEHFIVDERSATSPLLILSNLTSYFVTKGVPQNVIYLLLVVPFITFTVAFFRQFIGIYTYGVYTPLMLSLSFLILGLEFGLIVFLAVMLVSYLLRLLFEKIEMLYIPKVCLLFSFLAFSFFLVLGVGLYFETSINLTLTIFPMLMMVSLSEKFISTQSSSGIRHALISTGETIVVSLLAYFLVSWEFLQTSVLALPELITIPMLALVWLGKFTGLRLTEYFKFRHLFREDSQE